MIKSGNEKILIAIPAYNCSGQITRTLDEIDEKLLNRVEEIIIIDNQSTDETLKVAMNYQKNKRLKNKLHIYRNVDNYSLGGSHKVAFLHAKNRGFSHVIILHGDNQAKSAEASQLIDFIKNNPRYQTVLGSRFNKKSILIGYDKKRIFGNKVLNIIFSIFTFRKCEDLGSGLNLFALKDLNEEAYLQFADKLTFNYELLLDLIKRKVSFAYLPITWREEDQVTNARNLNIFKTALINLLQWRFGKKYAIIKKPENYKSKEIKQL